MSILVYVDCELPHAGFATQDVVLPCSGEVLATAGFVHPFDVSRILAQTEHMPEECWQRQADCDKCPVYDWRRSG